MKDYNSRSGLEDIIKISLDKVKTLIETKTVIGEPIKIQDGTIIIPITKTSIGFVIGGGEYNNKTLKKHNGFPLAGGSGCGMSVKPLGFIVISNNEVNFVDIENKSLYQTVLNLINSIVGKFNNKDNNKQE